MKRRQGDCFKTTAWFTNNYLVALDKTNSFTIDMFIDEINKSNIFIGINSTSSIDFLLAYHRVDYLIDGSYYDFCQRKAFTGPDYGPSLPIIHLTFLDCMDRIGESVEKSVTPERSVSSY